MMVNEKDTETHYQVKSLTLKKRLDISRDKGIGCSWKITTGLAMVKETARWQRPPAPVEVITCYSRRE